VLDNLVSHIYKQKNIFIAPTDKELQEYSRNIMLKYSSLMQKRNPNWQIKTFYKRQAKQSVKKQTIKPNFRQMKKQEKYSLLCTKNKLHKIQQEKLTAVSVSGVVAKNICSSITPSTSCICYTHSQQKFYRIQKTADSIHQQVYW
jgi:hypothetical protein